MLGLSRLVPSWYSGKVVCIHLSVFSLSTLGFTVCPSPLQEGEDTLVTVISSPRLLSWMRKGSDVEWRPISI